MMDVPSYLLMWMCARSSHRALRYYVSIKVKLTVQVRTCVTLITVIA